MRNLLDSGSQSKKSVVILESSVLAFGPWKHPTSGKSFSCFSSRVVYSIERFQSRSDENLKLIYHIYALSCMLQRN